MKTLPRDENSVPLQGTYKSITPGAKTVAVAGTPVALVSSSTDCKMVQIVAKDNNTGIVYIGNSSVLASTKTGIPLSPLGSFSLGVTDVSLIYVDADTSGDGVSFCYFD